MWPDDRLRAVGASAPYGAGTGGVPRGMPMGQARRLCPHAVVVPPSHGDYSRVSDCVFEVIEGFTPRVEVMSVDEAFIDIAGLRLLHAGPLAVAEAIRAGIMRGVGIPASIGLATT